MPASRDCRAATWHHLYLALVRPHDIGGSCAFPGGTDRQLEVPGLVTFRAEHDNQVVSMAPWYGRTRSRYYYLAASSDLGIGSRVGRLVLALTRVLPTLHFIAVDLGAAAGGEDVADGLSRSSRAGRPVSARRPLRPNFRSQKRTRRSWRGPVRLAAVTFRRIVMEKFQ